MIFEWSRLEQPNVATTLLRKVSRTEQSAASEVNFESPSLNPKRQDPEILEPATRRNQAKP